MTIEQRLEQLEKRNKRLTVAVARPPLPGRSASRS